MLKKISNFLQGAVPVVWSLYMMIVMLLLVGWKSRISYPGKTAFLLPEGILLLLGIALTAAIGFIFRRLDQIPHKILSRGIRMLSVGLFCVQLCVFYNIYFLTG